MAIDFPNSPTSGDTYTVNGKTWIWDGSVWAAYGNYPDPAVLKVDTVNGRVGVNKTNPTVALDVTGAVAVSSDLTVGGDFTVSGTTTTINTTDLNVEDNIITLNYGVTGTPTLDAGIEVERGDSANTSITWDESAESWVVGGTAYVDTANSRVGIGTSTPTVSLDVVGDTSVASASGDDYLNVDVEADDTHFRTRLSRSLSMDGQSVDLSAYDSSTYTALPLNIDGDPVSINNLRGIGAVDFTLADSVTFDGSITDYGTAVALNSGDNQLVSQLVTDGSTWGEVRAWNTNTEGNIELYLSGSTVYVGNDVDAGSGTMFVDSSTNRVGIGTTSPAEALDVAGNITVSGEVSGGSTSFPTSLDSNQLAAIEALQAKVGVDGSAVTTSLDYRTDQLESGNFVDTGLTAVPNVSTLATVTNVVGTPEVVGFEYPYTGAYTPILRTGSLRIEISASTSGVTAGIAADLDAAFTLNQTIRILVGSLVFFEAEYAGYTDFGYNIYIHYANPVLINPNYFDGPGSPTKIYDPATSTVSTDNSSLALNETYFAIGDNVYLSADASVSGGDIDFVEIDVSSDVSIGDAVTETYYTEEPVLTAFDSGTGFNTSRSLVSIVNGYRFIDQIYYLSSGTFNKADYPNAKAVRVTVVGGGGGSGALAACSSTQGAAVGGAGCGGYGIGWFRVDDSWSSATVTVGSGGAGGDGAAFLSGSNGGSSSFVIDQLSNTLISAGGGGRSVRGSASSFPVSSAYGGDGGVLDSNVWWLEFEAADRTTAGSSIAIASNILIAGGGGGLYSGGIRTGTSGVVVGGDGGVIAVPGYSSRGGGSNGRAQTNRGAYSGWAGTDGVVIVEVFG